MDFFKDIGMDKNDLFFILFLLIFSTILTVKMVGFNNQIGIYCSDVFVYLLNALNFVGMNLNADSTMYLSPVICFLTSILFRLGFIDVNAIYLVTGVFAIFGIVGFYFLLRYRFNRVLSLTGAVLLFSLSLNVLWLANGTLDVPAVGLTVWTVLFFVLAVDEDSKYYLWALPFFVLSFFTRYTTVLILPALLVYFLCKHDIFGGLDNFISDRGALKLQLTDFIHTKEFRNILKGVFLSLILVGVFAVVIYYYTHSFAFSSLFNNLSSGSKSNVGDSAYTTDTFFYLTNFLSFLFAKRVVFFKFNIPTLYLPSLTSYVVMFLTIVGLFVGLINKFKNKEQITCEVGDFKTGKFTLVLKLSVIVLFLVGVLSLGRISSFVVMLIFALDLVILNELLKKYDEVKGLSFHLMMLMWFLTYLVSFSLIYIKVNRYILTLMPAFVYFFILGLHYITGKWNYNFKNKINSSQILAILLIIVFVFSAFNFTSTVDVSSDIKSPELISDYLTHYDPNYQTRQIGVYNKRPFTWFLGMKLFGITKDNRAYLTNSNITYYIANEQVDNLTNYHLLKTQGKLHLYERNK